MVTIGEKYVERVEKALVETLVLHHVRTNPLTIDQIWTEVRNVGFDDKVDKGFVESCAKRLDRDGHVKEENGRYRITDDGREDIHKLESVFRNVADRLGTGVGGTKSVGTTGTTRTGMR